MTTHNYGNIKYADTCGGSEISYAENRDDDTNMFDLTANVKQDMKITITRVK